MAGAAASGPVIAQLVEALRALAGSHPGFRPVHAKGIVCSGTFHGAPDARRSHKGDAHDRQEMTSL
jgi:catalase